MYQTSLAKLAKMHHIGIKNKTQNVIITIETIIKADKPQAIKTAINLQQNFQFKTGLNIMKGNLEFHAPVALVTILVAS